MQSISNSNAIRLTSFADSGWLGRAPLPPLKGVRSVIRSKPDMKSWYSFSMLTLMWAISAVIRINVAKPRLMAVTWLAVAMPRKTQTKVRIKKLGRAVAIRVAIRRSTASRLCKVVAPIVRARRNRSECDWLITDRGLFKIAPMACF